MRYYELDLDGWPRASYARPQPGKDLQHLPEQPSEHHYWGGDQWVKDAASVAAEWHARISERADTELQRGVSVTIGGTTYGIRTGPQALALIDGGAIRADVAARNNQSVTRRVPTDQGIVQFDGPALWSMFEAVEDHQQAVTTRAQELEAKVADGTITESDLEEGWP